MKCSCCVECIRSWSDLQVFSQKNKLLKVAERRVPVLHVCTWKMQTWTIKPSTNADCWNEPNLSMSSSGVWLSASGSQPAARGCMSTIYALSVCLTLLFLMFVLTVSYLTWWCRTFHQSNWSDRCQTFLWTVILTGALPAVIGLFPPRVLFSCFLLLHYSKCITFWYFRIVPYVIASSKCFSKKLDLFRTGRISLKALCHPEAALKVS